MSKILRIYAVCFSLVASCPCLFSQSISEIKGSKKYYYGEGIGSTPKRAEDEALQSLLNAISVTLASETFIGSEQVTVNGKAEFTESAKAILKSYSSATLKNTEKIEWQEDDAIHVLCYLHRAEVKKIFAEREEKIKDFVAIAHEAELKLQLADALKYYYWALLLLQSHPDGNTISAAVDGSEQKLSLFLPQQINRLFDGISCKVTGKKTETNLTIYNLLLAYNGQPVSNLEYKTHDGRSWSRVIGAKNGAGTAEMIGDKPDLHKSIHLLVEYEFGDEWKTDREVDAILPNVKAISFKKASLQIEIKKVEKFDPVASVDTSGDSFLDSSQPSEAEAKPATNAVAKAGITASVDGAQYLPLLQKVQNAIVARQYGLAQDCFTAEGFDIYKKLVGNGKAVICGQPNYKFVRFDDGILARSLPMRFTFSNRRQFVENVVFDIESATGKIRSLQFAVSDGMAYDVARNDQWNEYSRMAIINFIETYQTAYALKRLDYLKSIFSEDALIIVGRVVHPAATVENRYIPPKVEQTRYDKATYMKNLEQCFRSQEYINLKFADTNITKAGKGGEMYGIQMQQDYFSATYGDKGYLFLYVDLNDPFKPIIHVRTWQPEKDPEIGVYNVGNF
ncbi:MAG: hypothetical protein LBJ57_04275 [Prevotellaceae bacterium]|jgi:hypothetical protein|nr:hypothetical protein [Prevotellaceae bacterium]